ncbi:MAG: hypothetical protein JW742_08310, partial [Candidatus Aminicenantes bacterium]|nr:hypothetical protein [Candidatus Aminicenantes bacterium]
PAGPDEAELRSVPVFENTVHVRHRGKTETVLENAAGGEIVWKAVFPGRRETLLLDDAEQTASQGRDDNGRNISWIVVRVGPGERRAVRVSASEDAERRERRAMPPARAAADAFSWGRGS